MTNVRQRSVQSLPAPDPTVLARDFVYSTIPSQKCIMWNTVGRISLNASMQSRVADHLRKLVE